MSMLVLIHGTGIVRWNSDGVRRAHAFRSPKASRRRSRLAVDQAAPGRPIEVPVDVARKLLEAFPGAEIRGDASGGS